MPRIEARHFAATCVACLAAIGTMTFVVSGQQRAGTRATAAAGTEWPTYGHDPGAMRYSPVAQITAANVSQLETAWVYHMKPANAAASASDTSDAPPQGRGGRGGAAGGFAAGETTPLVVNGIMYVTTPYGRVIALDPTTGKEKWVFPLPSGNPSTRGAEYFPGDRQTPAQIVFGSSDGKLYSLDAVTGEPNDAFGVKGVVDLNTPEILQGLPGND